MCSIFQKSSTLTPVIQANAADYKPILKYTVSTQANTQRWPNFSKLVFFAHPKKKKNSGFYKTEMRKRKHSSILTPKTLPLPHRPPWCPGLAVAQGEYRAPLQFSPTESPGVDPPTPISAG